MHGKFKIFGFLLSLLLHIAILFSVYVYFRYNNDTFVLPFAERHLATHTISESNLREMLAAANSTSPPIKAAAKTSVQHKTLVIVKPVQKRKPNNRPKQTKKPKPQGTLKEKSDTVDKKSVSEPVDQPIEKSPEEQAREERIVVRYQKRIQSALVNTWTRPSNLQRGQALVVQIELELRPNGSVKRALVHESSGDSLFDRSAIAAVKKNIRFAVPTDTMLFERYFKNIIIAFSNPGG